MEIMQPARLSSYARCILRHYFPIVPRWSAKMLGWAASSSDAVEYLIRAVHYETADFIPLAYFEIGTFEFQLVLCGFPG